MGIAWDFALSFKAAMDLRDILVMMEKARAELVHIQKRLDVIIALADSDLQARREQWNEAREARRAAVQQQRAKIGENMSLKAEELKAGIEEKFAGIKQRALEKPSAYLESVREEIGELRIKYRLSLERREGSGRVRKFYKNVLRSNPSMTSRIFKDAWEEWKKLMEDEPGEEQE